jgi:hypothetical protein
MKLVRSVLAVGVLVSVATAGPFSGSVLGSWINVNSSDATDVYSVNNNDAATVSTFNWGVPATTPFNNQFTFDGLGFSGVNENDPFAIGLFDYRNGSTYNSTGINGVDLQVGLTLTSPTAVSDNYTFSFNIINTPNNTGNPVTDGDIVNVASAYSPTAFSFGGIDYTLNLLGFSSDGGATIRNDFSSPEGGQQRALLYARITSEIPHGVPEPASLSFVGMGLIALVGLIRRRRG